MKSIGNRIKNRREELGLSQDELAQKLGYKSRSSINKIESGERNLTQSKIKAIADALNTTPGYIMGWSEGNVNLLPPEEAADIMFKLSQDEEALIKILRGATEKEKKMIAEMIYFIIENKQDN